MLSTRLTGSSTSMTVESSRSAASSVSSAPGRGEVLGDERPARVVVEQPLRFQDLGQLGVRAVGEHRGVRLDAALAGHVGQRRVPVVAGEHLVGALPGLHDLDRLRRPPRTSRWNATQSWLTIGSAMAVIALSTAGSIRAGSTRICWWSVAKCSAIRSEYSNSSPDSPAVAWKPTLNVFSPTWPSSASSATTSDESSPPESSTPTGTSATIRRRTASRSASRMASRQSRGAHPGVLGPADVLGPPVDALAAGAVRLDRADGGRRQLADPGQDRARRRHHRVERHVVVQRDRVDRGVDAAAGQQRGQRRGEAQPPGVLGQVQRLDARAGRGPG